MLSRATEGRRRDRLGWRALVRREREILVLLVVAAVCLLLFRQIAEIVGQGRANAFDLRVLNTLRPPGVRHDTLGWVWANIGAHDLSAMGSISVLAYIVVLVVGLFVGLKRWREAALLFLASTGGLIMTVGLQALFNRPRPPLTPEEAAGLNASFPSGHALLSATVYLTLGALIGHFAERRFVRCYALGAAAVLTVIVGVSRIFLGMHWCTDVLAGWCVGLAWALTWRAIALVWERLSRRRLGTGSVPRAVQHFASPGVARPGKGKAMAQVAAEIGARWIILKYAGVSLIGFAIDAALLQAGVRLGLEPAWARVISLFCAMQATFVLNGLHVFKALEWRRLPRQWASYMATNVFGNFCNYLIFVTMVSTHWWLVSDQMFALALSSFTAWLLNFASTRFLVFRKATPTIRRVP